MKKQNYKILYCEDGERVMYKLNKNNKTSVFIYNNYYSNVVITGIMNKDGKFIEFNSAFCSSEKEFRQGIDLIQYLTKNWCIE